MSDRNASISPLEAKEFALRQRIRNLENMLAERDRAYAELQRSTSIRATSLTSDGDRLRRELNSLRMYAVVLLIVTVVAIWV